MAAWMTAMGVGGAMITNIALAIMIARALGVTFPDIPIWVSACFLGLVLLVHYDAFVRRDRHLEIVQRFRELSTAQRRRLTVVAWAYLIASLGLPAAFAWSMAALTEQ